MDINEQDHSVRRGLVRLKYLIFYSLHYLDTPPDLSNIHNTL